jgi:exo-beta-1,3-glucanase (GH17 family)
VPSPHVTSYPTTGTYTIPATTVTLTTTETIPYPTSTVCAPGKCTYGGVTTSVTTNTIVTCPYAHTTTSNGVVYSTITQTTYSCPSSGLYTIGPYTTTVTDTYTVEYPTVTYYNPGTYSAPEKTVTVTKTNEVYTCPYETVKPTYTPKPSTYAPKPSTYAPKPPKNTYVPPPKPTATAYQAPPHKPKHHSPPVHKPHTGPVVNGDQWAMTYTPYGNDGQCKSSSEVASDIAIIASKGFTTVRLYSTDCDTLPSVGSACEAHGIRIILGIFIDSSGISGAREQLDDIMSCGKFDMVDMVVVGNEALFNGYCTTSELAALIIEVRSSIRGAGCNAPVTTTEPLISLQEYGGDLCHAMDVVAANLQPYFNADTSAADAGDFVAGQLELVGKVCPGLEAYNLECGWPNAGGANGAAVPGYSEQAEAIKSIVAKVGSKTVIFSYQNDAWKSSGLNGVEPHFGCIDVF